MPYVTENIQKNGTVEDWRFREAATFAFGCILDGPDPQALGELARSGLSYLLTALSDANPLVKNTTAWCLGRIFEFVHGELEPPLIATEQLSLVVQTLLNSLQDELYIAEKVCYAISKLATGYSDASPSPMTQWFEVVVGKLLETSTRGVAEAGQSNIQIQAFAAINEVVSCVFLRRLAHCRTAHGCRGSAHQWVRAADADLSRGLRAAARDAQPAVWRDQRDYYQAL